MAAQQIATQAANMATSSANNKSGFTIKLNKRTLSPENNKSGFKIKLHKRSPSPRPWDGKLMGEPQFTAREQAQEDKKELNVRLRFQRQLLETLQDKDWRSKSVFDSDDEIGDSKRQCLADTSKEPRIRRSPRSKRQKVDHCWGGVQNTNNFGGNEEAGDWGQPQAWDAHWQRAMNLAQNL